MKKLIFFLATLLPIGVVMAQDDNTEKLWYDTPAKIWLEALPIGNSHLGAMVYGGIQKDEIQLNEETFWSGGPHNNNSKTSLNYLEQVRNLIFSGKESEAESIINNQFVVGPHGMKYLTLGSLTISSQSFSDNDASDFHRELDLQKALSTVSFTVKKNDESYRYTRTTFASMADGVIVMRIESEKEINFMIQHACTFNTSYKKKDSNGIVATIQGVGHETIDGKLRAECVYQVESDGTVRASSSGMIAVRGAKTATLYISAATNFVNYNDVTGSPTAKNQKYLDDIAQYDYEPCWLAISKPIRSSTIVYTSLCHRLPIVTCLLTSAWMPSLAVRTGAWFPCSSTMVATCLSLLLSQVVSLPTCKVYGMTSVMPHGIRNIPSTSMRR